MACELLGKSEEYVKGELTGWRKTEIPVPEKFTGSKGIYFRLFDFLDGYHEFKTQEKGG